MNLSADERFAILDVIYAYNLAADEKDVEETLKYYVEEGRIEGDMETGQGKDAMRADLPKIFKSEVTLKRHIAINVRFTAQSNADEVTVKYILFVMEAKAAPISIATSIVTDQFRKTNGEWKVVLHRVEVDPSARWLVKGGQKAMDAIENVKDALS